MGTRYIGAKTKIASTIVSEIQKLVPKNGTVSDLMCGTGAVSVALRKKGYKVIASDVMAQAFHITRARVLLQKPPNFERVTINHQKNGQVLLTEKCKYELVIQTLNNLIPLRGYFWQEFSPGGLPVNGSKPRKYFSEENAKKIDSVREYIYKLKINEQISEIEHSLLIHDLIMATNDVANIAGTYGHYLSKFVSRALQPIVFSPKKFERGGSSKGHKFLLGYAEDLAPKIVADLCYIDPPYKKRQYAANYHILETLAKGDFPIAQGKSGLRLWRDQYSDFCSKLKIRNAFKKIITQANCDTFLISYSSEGLLSKQQMFSTLKKFGKVEVLEFKNKRFKSRNEEAKTEVIEYLFCLEKK